MSEVKELSSQDEVMEIEKKLASMNKRLKRLRNESMKMNDRIHELERAHFDGKTYQEYLNSIKYTDKVIDGMFVSTNEGSIKAWIEYDGVTLSYTGSLRKRASDEKPSIEETSKPNSWHGFKTEYTRRSQKTVTFVPEKYSFLVRRIINVVWSIKVVNPYQDQRDALDELLYGGKRG